MATSVLTINNEVNPGVQLSDFARTQVETNSFVLPTSSSDAKFFDKSQFSAVSIYVDGAGGNTITFYGCTKTAMRASTVGAQATAVALRDKTGTAITLDITNGAGIYNINPEIFSMPFIAPVINSGSVNAILIGTK